MKWLVPLCLLGCAGPPPAKMCADVCTKLVGECAFDAFPDRDSCVQGCAYDVTEGGHVHGFGGCLEEAECDTFAVLQCARTYGVQ